MNQPVHHILISDRNHNVRTFLRREFLLRGYAVCTARNGQEVLASLDRSPPPELLLLDMHLTDCEHPGFWDQLLTDPAHPFIVIHAFSDDLLPDELVGHVARVTKNGDIESLARAVSWCLNRHHGRRSR